MSRNVHTVLFAVVLCCVISVLLTAASTGLQKFQQKNIRLDRQKNILKSVGLILEKKKYSAEAVEKLYQENIRSVWTDPAGKILAAPQKGKHDLPIYLYIKNEHIKAYIRPINSRGLWGRILGYLAIRNDGATVYGFTVYKHSETPGLGGEIVKEWFQKNYVGKKIVNQKGEFVSVSIAKGKAAGRVPEELALNYVDGISGATLTGKYLTAGMKEIILDYEPVSINFRKNLIKRWPKGE